MKYAKEKKAQWCKKKKGSEKRSKSKKKGRLKKEKDFKKELNEVAYFHGHPIVQQHEQSAHGV